MTAAARRGKIPKTWTLIDKDGDKHGTYDSYKSTADAALTVCLFIPVRVVRGSHTDKKKSPRRSGGGKSK